MMSWRVPRFYIDHGKGAFAMIRGIHLVLNAMIFLWEALDVANAVGVLLAWDEFIGYSLLLVVSSNWRLRVGAMNLDEV